MISPGTAVIRLLIAFVLGAAIGFERERGERGAGLRTLSLVSLASALITIVSGYGFQEFLSLTHISLDPSRVAAQIVTGVGFLGAGTIFLRRGGARGLTTAAAIWFVAGIGLACGTGMIFEATFATALALVVLALLRPVEQYFFPRAAAHTLRATLSRGSDPAQAIRRLSEVSARHQVRLQNLTLHRTGDVVEVSARCRGGARSNLPQYVTDLSALEGMQAMHVELDLERYGTVPTVED